MERIRKASRKLAMQGRDIEEDWERCGVGVGWGGVQGEDSWDNSNWEWG